MRVLVANLHGRNGGNRDIDLLYTTMSRRHDVELRAYTHELAASGWADIIHINWPEWTFGSRGNPLRSHVQWEIGLGALRIARLRGTKVVWTAHNVVPHESDERGRTLRRIHDFAALVDLVVCPSQSVLDLVLEKYLALSTTARAVIPSGLYREIYHGSRDAREESREALRIPHDARVVLAFGMVRHYKNIPQIIACQEAVAAARPDVFLLVAGKPFPSELGAQVERRAAGVPNVRLDLGEIPEADVNKYFQAADCSLNAATLAVNSGVALLSLSLGCPVVMPARGSAHELADAAGPEWVRLFSGGMRPAVYEAAAGMPRPDGHPDLGPEYNWETSALRHYQEFRQIARTSRQP